MLLGSRTIRNTNAPTTQVLDESKIALGIHRASLIFKNHWLLEKYWGMAQDYYDTKRDYEAAISFGKWRIE